MSSTTPANSADTNTDDCGKQVAPLRRRLMAMVYDGLLLLAILFCTSMIYMTVVVVLTGPDPELLNAREGDVITELEPVPMGWPILPLLVLVYTGFYSFFWLRSGQTLGMQAWKIRLQSCDGSSLTLKHCLLRLLTAPLSLLPAGLGYWAMLFNRERGTWHDRLSSTKVILCSD